MTVEGYKFPGNSGEEKNERESQIEGRSFLRRMLEGISKAASVDL